MKLVILILFSFLISFSFVSAKEKAGNSKRVNAFKLEQSINLDGILEEEIWSKPPVKEFTQRDPEEGNPATEPTHVWVAYDDSYLYVGARLYDSKLDELDASLARRDSWHDSDWFTFYVDPYLDRKTGYYFAVNAGGSIRDGVFYNDSWNTDSWDGIWEAKTSVNGDDWTIEMKIPFSQLRFNQADVMNWGINFKRELKRKKEVTYFVMIPKTESGFVSHFATLEGIQGVEPKQRLEILPYIVQKAQYLVHDENDPFYKGNQYKTTFGADIKVGIGTNLNLDLTVNPDFGQVEVDPAVLNLSAFETYYPEKRPFFIEGGNIFSFGSNGSNSNWGFNFGNPDLIYSRRIGRSPQGPVPDNEYVNYPTETRILGAAKLTGKLNDTWSLGAVSALTERTYANYRLEGNEHQVEVEPLTHYGAIRAQKEINGGKQGLGFIATAVNRDLRTPELEARMSDQAYVFGLDGWTYLDDDETYALTGYVIGSYTTGSKDYLTRLQKQPYRYMQRPDATYMTLDTNRTSLSGVYSRIALNKQKGNFYINSALGLVSPGFENNDLGFQWMADRINGHTVLGYRWYDPDSLFRQKWFYVSHARTYDFEGNNYQNLLWGRIGGQFHNYWEFGLVLFSQTETMVKTLTRGGPMMKNPSYYGIEFWGNTDSRKDVMFYAGGYFNSDALGSNAYNAWLEMVWKPNSQISFTFGPEYQFMHEKTQWVTRIEDASAVNTYGNRYIFANIDQDLLAANIRLNWTFTPTLSLQLYLQPLFAVGAYSNFKEAARPSSLDYNDYGKNGSTVSYDSENSEYTVDPDGDGPTSSFTFGNPDFNFKSLRGNIVLRWEVLPGSIFYFVWAHDQTNFDDPGKFNLGNDFKNLWAAEGNDIFLVKFSYWFDM
ncbi:MAG: carbohydrate binding family 9 domain-containing protein [Melioribacteraceae bacterium]|nr:carbohydrate binding family 9 domain-containing protein [Melioribacteraceae bacterium]